MALVVPTRTLDSGVHGRGLFLAEPVRQGTPIWRQMPQFTHEIGEAAFLALPEDMRLYVVWYGCWNTAARRWELPVDEARFINHDETPSALYVAEDDVLVAARDLPEGTEITNDYRAICGFFARVPSFEKKLIVAALVGWHELFG